MKKRTWSGTNDDIEFYTKKPIKKSNYIVNSQMKENDETKQSLTKVGSVEY